MILKFIFLTQAQTSVLSTGSCIHLPVWHLHLDLKLNQALNLPHSTPASHYTNKPFPQYSPSRWMAIVSPKVLNRNPALILVSPFPTPHTPKHWIRDANFMRGKMVSSVLDLLNLEYMLITQVEMPSSQVDLRICSWEMRFVPGIWGSSPIQRREREVARKSLKSQIFNLVIEWMVTSFTVIQNTREGTVF